MVVHAWALFRNCRLRNGQELTPLCCRMSGRVWRAQRARNLGLISDYASDYFSGSSAGSEYSNPQSENEEERGELVSDRVSRPKVRAPPRYPRPHSHLLSSRDGQRARGNKHARRWENSVFINSLYQLPEEEVKAGFSILPDYSSQFTLLHTNRECMQDIGVCPLSLKAWYTFTSCPEEEQGAILGDGQRGTEGRSCGRDMGGETADQRYLNIDRHIRGLLKHNKHLPCAFLQALETELTQYFATDPRALVVAIHPDTFHRLLVHGLCQYMGLTSTTLHKDGVSLMLLEYTRHTFTPPPVSLVTHLTRHTLTSPHR